MDSGIAEKVRKLHALAERAGTEHEAANAAARVADLCRKHQLDLGAVLLAEQEKHASTATISHKGSWRSYRTGLCRAVCVLLDVDWYRSREGWYYEHRSFDLEWSATFFGLSESVSVAIPTYVSLQAAVARILREAVKAGRVASDSRSKASFRLGCSRRIEREARTAAAQASEASQCSEGAQDIKALGDRLKDEFRSLMQMRLKAAARKSAPDWRAFSAGFEAAKNIDLYEARTRRLLKA